MNNAVRPRTAERLLLRVAQEQATNRLPSVVAGVVRDGRLVWWGGRGRVGDAPPTADTQYRIGSITKTFVATCVMRLRDEGRLDLTDPIGKHLPGTPVGDATVAQLLSHSAGLRAETDGPWWERTAGAGWDSFAAGLESGAQRHRPGSRFHYSNVGYGVLGQLVSQLRGMTWDAAVRTELLEPLGMHRTTTRPVPPHAQGYAVHPWADVLIREPEHDAGAMGPAGQLWSTVGDLANWAAFLGGDSGGLLAPDTLAEMRQPQVVDDPPGAAWRAGYGLGLQVWNIDGARYVGHGGSMPGFLAGLRVDVLGRDAVVAVTNSTAFLSPEFIPDLAAILATEEPLLPAEWTPTAVPSEVLELTGSWYWGPSPLVIRAMADRWLELRGLAGPARASRFRPEADGTWTGLDGYYAGESLRAIRDGSERVVQLDLASFCLTRRPYDPAADVPGGVHPDGWSEVG